MTSVWPSREKVAQEKMIIFEKNKNICYISPPLCSSSGGLRFSICGNVPTLSRPRTMEWKVQITSIESLWRFGKKLKPSEQGKGRASVKL